MTILIADDNEEVRKGVKDLLESQAGWHVVGEAVNGRDALEKAVQLAPQVVVLDITMPEMDGISAAPLIRGVVPQAELLVLSQHDAPSIIARAFGAGVRGYGLKSQVSRDLVPAIEAAGRHASFLSSEISAVESGPLLASALADRAGGGGGSSDAPLTDEEV